MLIKPPSDIPSSEITPKRVYLNRREFVRAAAGTVAAVAAGSVSLRGAEAAPHGAKLPNVKKSSLSTTEKPNTWEQITTYNNYYEFGFDKDDPATFARNFKTEPWTIAVEGECNKKAVYHLKDVLKGETLEDRIYRHRCVEAWAI